MDGWFDKRRGAVVGRLVADQHGAACFTRLNGKGGNDFVGRLCLSDIGKPTGKQQPQAKGMADQSSHHSAPREWQVE
jgi:hypothetical protein